MVEPGPFELDLQERIVLYSKADVITPGQAKAILKQEGLNSTDGLFAYVEGEHVEVKEQFKTKLMDRILDYKRKKLITHNQYVEIRTIENDFTTHEIAVSLRLINANNYCSKGTKVLSFRKSAWNLNTLIPFVKREVDGLEVLLNRFAASQND